MYILYVDESGRVSGKKGGFFVLAGVSIFERQTFWVSRELDKIAARFNPTNPQGIELHGSHMWGGKGVWRKIPRADREEAIKSALRVLAHSHRSNRIFGVSIEFGAVEGEPIEYAFSQLASRFDQYLGRLDKKENNKQRGIILFDKSAHERVLQSRTNTYRKTGHEWGRLTNFAEVPVFGKRVIIPV